MPLLQSSRFIQHVHVHDVIKKTKKLIYMSHVTPLLNGVQQLSPLEFITTADCSAAMSAEYRVVDCITEDISPTTVKNISGLTLDVIMRLFADPLQA